MTNYQHYKPDIEKAVQELQSQDILARIWKRDHTVWKPIAEEISNRLGWLDIARRMEAEVPEIQHVAEEVCADGLTHVLLLGMGGSSLAPEVFRKVFGVKPGYLDLSVLDSTDPGAVLKFKRELDPHKTLYIVSTKSGGTVETFSFMRYFYNHVGQTLGWEEAGTHFIAITDPGSMLEELATRFHFRHIFRNDPNIGGRYSALSHFGLVPAAMLGIDLPKLLANALDAMRVCAADVAAEKNPAAALGAALGVLARQGRDKLTFVLSPSIAPFGDWVEQLVAESTGKEGCGILPVVGEQLLEADAYAADRVFVHIELEPELFQTAQLAALEDAGHPCISVKINDVYDLAGQFFVWELATAVAGHMLGINPFDQPNVESAKVLARQMVAAYKEEGTLPASSAQAPEGKALEEFLSAFETGRSYVALHAYLPPSPEMHAVLQQLRTRIQTRYRAATTLGYGPRFLHSTGQLHKGDGGNGFFIQFSADAMEDDVIPDEMDQAEGVLSFGVLEMAQALGDAQALLANQRRVIRFHLGQDALEKIKEL